MRAFVRVDRLDTLYGFAIATDIGVWLTRVCRMGVAAYKSRAAFKPG